MLTDESGQGAPPPGADDERDPLADVAAELSRLGEAAAERDLTPDQLRDRLWAISARLNPHDPQDQVRRVGVVVFCEVKATSDHDAGAVAAMALRQIAPSGTVVPTRTMRAEPTPVRIGEAMEVGMAARNGYLTSRITNAAWRQYDLGMWDGQKPASDEESRDA